MHGMLATKSVSTNFVVSALISADVSLSQVASTHLKNWMNLNLSIDIAMLLIDESLE